MWLGTSVENQRYADERIPLLAAVPARTRFLSCEPILGPVDLAPWLNAGQLGRVITGGESGSGRREMDVAWLTSIAGQRREGDAASDRAARAEAERDAARAGPVALAAGTRSPGSERGLHPAGRGPAGPGAARPSWSSCAGRWTRIGVSPGG